MYLGLCPVGAEGTTYAMLTTFSNLAGTVAFDVSTALTQVWDVDEETLLEGDYMPDWKRLESTPPYMLIPERTMEGFRKYLFEGVPTGDFLKAVLDNNLFEAFGRADEGNRGALWLIVKLVYNEFPLCARDRKQWLEWHYRLQEENHPEEETTYASNTPARESRSEYDPSL